MPAYVQAATDADLQVPGRVSVAAHTLHAGREGLFSFCGQRPAAGGLKSKEIQCRDWSWLVEEKPAEVRVAVEKASNATAKPTRVGWDSHGEHFQSAPQGHAWPAGASQGGAAAAGRQPT